MKKINLGIILILPFLLSGCFGGQKPAMDELNQEGLYHYTNKDLGFEIKLPSTFIYYQVQRKVDENYTDVEFFVPTADTSYYQEIQSYAKPVVVRLWDKKYWDNLEDDEDKREFNEKGEKRGKVYTIKFWYSVPSDWESSWGEKDVNLILSEFKIY